MGGGGLVLYLVLCLAMSLLEIALFEVNALAIKAYIIKKKKKRHLHYKNRKMCQGLHYKNKTMSYGFPSFELEKTFETIMVDLGTDTLGKAICIQAHHI